MRIFLLLSFTAILFFVSGCRSAAPLPSEDIEVLTKYKPLIEVLKNPKLPPNSRQKYEAAKELIRVVDLYYTRETATVDKLLYHRDAQIDNRGSDKPVFTFLYRYGDHSVRIRFFTFKMFVTRVEITEE